MHAFGIQQYTVADGVASYALMLPWRVSFDGLYDRFLRTKNGVGWVLGMQYAICNMHRLRGKAE